MKTQAEQAIVGGCVIDNAAYWKIASIVRASDFANAFCRQAYTAIERASSAGDQFDVVTLCENFDLDLADLASIVNETPGAANIATYARIVRNESIMRSAIAEVSAARERLVDGDAGAIPELQSRLEALNRTEKPSTNFHDALIAGLDNIEAAQIAAQSKNRMVGAPTGVANIDDRLRGLSGGKLIILAARPSLGKTALALQAAQSAALEGYPVGILSLEMGADEIAIRSFAHQFSVNNTALAFGDREAVANLTNRLKADPEKMERIKNLPVYIDEDSFSIAGIVSRITEWKRKHDIKLAVVDHLQLVEVEKGFNRNDGLGEITRQLKILAKRLDIPVVLLCQLNRNVEREQRAPRLSDLRDSGNIEQDADIVISLHGSLEPNPQGAREVEIDFLKLRGGLVGPAGTAIFNGPTQTFKRAEFRYGD